MKILAVRLKNLNSLTGEWSVDFTHPDYRSDGIFAITGPTGAGKTTILDAICLGLYGRTPRLDRVTKSGNEIMSRQTGECFAEVSFETRKGRFLCHWSQRRARKKPDGELQPARHEVADLDTGKVLESHLTQVSAFIENATGMDFERFTRSMMLAQGGFSAFLAASPDERAPILEQITGTGIFSDISIRVHERRVRERAALDGMQGAMRGIQVLSEEEEQGLHAALTEKLSQEKGLADAGEALRKTVLWREGIMALEKERARLGEEQRLFEESWQAFEPHARRLARSLKALDLEGDYRESLALKVQQEGELKELRDALDALPEKEKAVAAALAARQASEVSLDETRAALTREGEIIKEVRALDARLGEQKKQLGDVERALTMAFRKQEEYRTGVKNAGEALLKAKADLDAIHGYQEAHAADGALLANLTVIARGFSSLKGLETRYARARADLNEAAEAKETFLAETRRAEEAHEESRQKFEAGRNEYNRLAEELAVLLEDREVGEWREEMERLKERESLLTRVAATMERMADTRGLLKDLNERIGALKAGSAEGKKQIEGLAARKALIEKEASGLEAQLTLHRRIRDLEEERKRLVDNAPCPLCGALDHPFARGNMPEAEGAEKDLATSREALREVAARLSRMEADEARTAEQILHLEKEAAQKQEALSRDEEECAGNLAPADAALPLEGLTEKVGHELSAVRDALKETSRIIAQADDMGKKERTARNSLESLRIQHDSSGRVLQDMRLKLQSLDLEWNQIKETGDSLDEEARKVRASVLRDVEPFGITELPSEDLNTALTGLTERRFAWQAKIDAKAALERTIHDLTAGMDKDSALLQNLEKETRSREEERDNLRESHEALLALRGSRYGERSPDDEEKGLIEAARLAEQAAESARAEHGRLDNELSSLKERRDALIVKTDNRSLELSQAQTRLSERMVQAGFVDMADYLSARLDEEERRTLSDRERALISEKTELETRLRDKAAALDAERGRNLTGEALDALVEKLAALEGELKQLRLGAGAISARLEENSKGKERQREEAEKVEAQKRECARWDELHQLIGSADGKKFRNFAQGLTFEIMTAHANRRLREMTDRYVLIHDPSQPLELSVIDNYQAGEIRSTKNLSGGESFIVSLALALGLSQMASRNVRVDSLFLDEGFGSLDEDALETALETLAGLKSTGKLIGVISHVPALKERIGAQILVIPKTGGHSIISGPGCSRGDRDRLL